MKAELFAKPLISVLEVLIPSAISDPKGSAALWSPHISSILQVHIRATAPLCPCTNSSYENCFQGKTFA